MSQRLRFVKMYGLVAGKATTDRRAFFVVRSYNWRVRRCCWRVVNGGHSQIAEAV